MFDELVARAVATPDVAARNDLYKQAEKIAIGDDLGVIPLFARQQFRLVNTTTFGNVNMDFWENPTLPEIPCADAPVRPRRSAQAVLVVVAATFLIFLATFALGDPFASTGEKVVPPAIAAANRAKFGLDQPLVVQFGTYLVNIARLDFGIDFDQGRPVSQMLAETVPNTVRLALVAIVIDVLIGVTAGVIAAVRRYSVWDVVVTVLSTVGIGVPTFVIGIVLVVNVAGWGPFPAVPRGFAVEVPWYQEVLLPALTLAAVDAAFVARLMRGSLLEVLRADYVRTARAKGLPERTVIGRTRCATR